MSEYQWVVLLLKIGLISGLVSLVGWVCTYSWLTRGGAWRHPIGVTLIVKALLIAALFALQILGLFFHLDGWTIRWLDVVFIWLVTPAMLWRSAVFMRIGSLPGHKPERGRTQPMEPPSPQDGEGGTDG